MKKNSSLPPVSWKHASNSMAKRSPLLLQRFKPTTPSSFRLSRGIKGLGSKVSGFSWECTSNAVPGTCGMLSRSSFLESPSVKHFQTLIRAKSNVMCTPFLLLCNVKWILAWMRRPRGQSSQDYTGAYVYDSQ